MRRRIANRLLLPFRRARRSVRLVSMTAQKRTRLHVGAVYLVTYLVHLNRHGRAMDQGRQVCREVDTAVVPEFQRQPDAASAIRPGVQPRKLPALVGAAEVGEALVVDHAAGEADQDRGEGCPPLQVRNIPDG